METTRKRFGVQQRANAPRCLSSQVAKKKGTTGIRNQKKHCQEPALAPEIRAILAQFTKPALMASQPWSNRSPRALELPVFLACLPSMLSSVE